MFIIPLFILIGLGFPASAKAQDLPKQKRLLTLEEVMQAAINKNPDLQASKLTVEQREKLEKTAYNLPKTSIYTGEEEVDPHTSEAVQTVVGISQSFEFPITYFNRKKVLDQETEISRINYNLDEYQLKKEVSKAYYNWGVAWQRWQFYTYLDSVYNRFYEAAQLRYETGEASSLEQLTAKGKQEQVRLEMEKAASDLRSFRNTLERWMNAAVPQEARPGEIKTGILPPLLTVDPIPKENPLLEVQKSQIALSEREIRLQRSQLLPDLNGQYAKQRINGQNGFYAWQVGVDIPLFFGAQRGRIQSAKVNRDIQEKRLKDLELDIKTSRQNLALQLQQLQKQLQYYEDEGLPLSKKMIENADLLFYTGEIGYVEYLQNVDRAVQLRISWLDALDRYNRTILDITYLTQK